MNINDILARIGYVRNTVNLSARELSLRMGMSPQYVAQIERGRIVLTVEKLLQILEICNFPLKRFFSDDIFNYAKSLFDEHNAGIVPLRLVGVGVAGLIEVDEKYYNKQQY